MKIFAAKRADTKLSELNRGEVFELSNGSVYIKTGDDSSGLYICVNLACGGIATFNRNEMVIHLPNAIIRKE